ncbi:hypothetical protein NE237_002745 [Protea cynaroides]|uniref:Uncharacterized protein n=1 Tax=Protea cynaroides TaxID=273540 RepID=A0A9Q0KG28_9MAGN|nr:hypothetical protein NE237_002745 [Protea cynaroides]
MPNAIGDEIGRSEENQIFYCGSDRSDIFERESLFRCDDDPYLLKKQRSINEKISFSPSSSSSSNYSRRPRFRRCLWGRTPRWVEFWRNSSSSSSSSAEIKGKL